MTNNNQSGFSFTELLLDPAQLEQSTATIGLVSMDGLINSAIGIHPYAVAETTKLTEQLQQVVLEAAGDYESPG